MYPRPYMANGTPTQPRGAAEYDISALYLPQIRVYRNVEDYLLRNGFSPRGFNPLLPVKLWDDPSAQQAGSTQITYNVVEFSSPGAPVVMPLTLSPAEALNANIPPPPPYQVGQPSTPPMIRSVPIRALLPNEKLLAGPAQSVKVVNMDLG